MLTVQRTDMKFTRFSYSAKRRSKRGCVLTSLAGAALALGAFLESVDFLDSFTVKVVLVDEVEEETTAMAELDFA